MGAFVYLLIKPSHSHSLYLTFDSVPKLMNGLCNRFEQRLSDLNPQRAQLTYDLRDLYNWLDTMIEINVFTPDGDCGGYHLCDLAWIKSQLGKHLISQ